jgi:hypothetical protein
MGLSFAEAVPEEELCLRRIGLCNLLATSCCDVMSGERGLLGAIFGVGGVIGGEQILKFSIVGEEAEGE